MTEMELARGGGTALWRQIAETVERDIIAGKVAPGHKLPTEHELATQFDVNRHTVRRAIAALAEKGLVRIEQGRGTFVQESVIEYQVRRRTRFSENIAANKREASGKLLKVVEMPAEGAVAKALEIRKGSPVVMIERLAEADGRPLSVSAHYFPKGRFPDIAAIYQESGSFTRALAHYGIADPARRTTRVTARMARSGDALLLQQPPNKPILMSEGINVDSTGRPVEYTVARWACDRVQLVFEGG
ncbi:phosphonate metabolism transcriptional regulator PhnF [Magnetospirillum sp. 64-120]|uniref:phosphonate metabolism transcriptional regulator PhnF n=1 Tax=Magnetospirillum sp. 64-120 TaxID=1895778 RepID=UPI000ADE7A78|nr:phosphonate metabolism transcriptional regulator PhnF [Magnetospirillum sp. 64-120]